MIEKDISKLSIIKEQVPTIDWVSLRLMVSILKRKYGLNPFESVVFLSRLKMRFHLLITIIFLKS
jgi:hypothetical protein